MKYKIADEILLIQMQVWYVTAKQHKPSAVPGHAIEMQLQAGTKVTKS